MFVYKYIDPVAFSFGPFAVRWYGLCYLFGFAGCYALCVWRGRGTQWTPQVLLDILFYISVGIILGGRIGYILFYDQLALVNNPLTLLEFWAPGRSFHGGMLGVFLALFIYCKFNPKKFIQLTDFIAPAVPIGLGFGRLGNFINGELYGRVTDVPWGMIFPHAGWVVRHPSQLYELLLEGFGLCFLLLWYARKPRRLGEVSGMFLVGYGTIRCMVELLREPDVGLHFALSQWVTMGQALSIPMILLGLYFLLRKRAD